MTAIYDCIINATHQASKARNMAVGGVLISCLILQKFSIKLNKIIIWHNELEHTALQICDMDYQIAIDYIDDLTRCED